VHQNTQAGKPVDQLQGAHAYAANVFRSMADATDPTLRRCLKECWSGRGGARIF
jgi:hypothetical protein